MYLNPEPKYVRRRTAAISAAVGILLGALWALTWTIDVPARAAGTIASHPELGAAIVLATFAALLKGQSCTTTTAAD